jgi:hypothetical protein
MSQSKLDSLIEACVNTAFGFCITLVISGPIYWACGVTVNRGQLMLVTILFTVVAVVRGYVVRRWFDNLGPIKKFLNKLFK